MNRMLQRITIKAALQKGFTQIAPLSYNNWYSYSTKIDMILLDPYWAQFQVELRQTDRLFINYGLNKEVGLLITTKQKQWILKNTSSPENYMRAELAWLELPTPLARKLGCW
jgi:hypothetical protein